MSLKNFSHLENRLEGHEKFAAFDAGLFAVVLFSVGEEVNKASKHVSFGEIEERVENVNARLIELQEFVGVNFVDFRAGIA